MHRQSDAETTSIFRRTTSRLHFDEIPTSKPRRVPAGYNITKADRENFVVIMDKSKYYLFIYSLNLFKHGSHSAVTGFQWAVCII